MNPNIIKILILLAIIILVTVIIKNIKNLRKFSKKQLEDLNPLDEHYDAVYLNLFNSNVELAIEKNIDKKYVEKCISHLNGLSDIVIDEVCKKLVGYYVRMLEGMKESYEALNEIKNQMPKKLDGREILQCIKPFTLIIEQPLEDIPAYTLYCDCVWEPEHGAWLIFKGDNILYCGDICEIGPWMEEEVYQNELGLLKDYFNDYDFVIKKLNEINKGK